MKKLFTSLFALVASVGTMFAYDNVKIGKLRYNLDDEKKTAEVISSSNYYSGDIVIPSSVEYKTITYNVTSIGISAFYSCSGLTSVTIPNSVTSIGDSAFYSCSSLSSIEIPNSVSNIGNHVFNYCRGLTSVTIPNSVTSIGDNAFSHCRGLTSVTIPNSVTSIGGSAFYGCTGLTSPIYNTHVFAFMPTTYSGSYTIPLGIESIVGFDYCTGLTSVTIPNSVTSIGGSAFAGCRGLKSIDIPNSVTSIGEGAFAFCSSLRSITIPNSVTSIGNSVFYFCTGLTSVTIPNSVTSIGNGAFRDCTGLRSIEIPNSVTSIGRSAFYGCTGLRSIEIPNSVTSIGSYAFSGCTGLTSVTIPNSVTSIGEGAFSHCTGLTSVTIPNSVTSIGESAFSGCTGLTTIEIPNSVTSIGDQAFRGCTGLNSVTCLAPTPPSLGESVFGDIKDIQSIPLYVFKESASFYKESDQWRDFNVKLLDPDIYTITASAQNGIVEGAGTFWEDTTIQLLAIPKEGYVFQKWSDGITINPRPIMVSENAAYEAEFVEKESIPTGDVKLPYSEPFSSEMGKFSIKDVNLGGLNYVWILTSDYGMKASAYVNKSFATESWLVSPLISLYNTKDIVLSFDHAVNKGTTANLRVKISTDLGESWSDLTVPNWPAGTNWDFVSTSLSLDAYTNNVIQIAFAYKSTTSNCPTWEIKNFSVKGTVTPEQPLPIDVESKETSADVTWLTISNANTYELIIRDKDGNVVCSIIFDAEGHAQSVNHYAPSLDKSSQQAQTNDFAYTVTGLTSNTDYNFILVAKDDDDKVVTTYSGSFRTKGSTQSIEDIHVDSDKPVKVLMDGHIYILRGEHVYDVGGKRVK